MTEYGDPQLADDTRRALALLTAGAYYDPVIDDPTWVWETLGETPDERYRTIIALVAMYIGAADAAGVDIHESLRQFGLAVTDIETGAVWNDDYLEG